jgi:capsular exopolysaccharide synthesis family protein
MSEYHSDEAPGATRALTPAVTHVQRAPMLDSIGIAPEEPLDWRRHMAATWRHRWWILGVTVLGTIGGALAARFFPARYQAQATIWIQSAEPRNGGNTARGPIGSNQLFEAYAWVNLLRSYVVLDEVARELRWYLRVKPGYASVFASFTVGQEYVPGQYRLEVSGTDSSFTLRRSGGEELQRGTVGDSIGQALGFRWAPSAQVLTPGSDVSFTIRPLRDAAKALGEALTVTMDEDGSFLRLALTGDDAARVAGTVNAVARRYVTVATQLKRVKVSEVAKLLADQLEAAGQDLHRAERAFETFRVRTITLAPDLGATPVAQGKTPMYSDFFTLKLEREQLRRDREAIERVLAQVRNSDASIEGLTFVGAVQRSGDLSQALRELTVKQAERRALRYAYTDDHPAVLQATQRIDMLAGTVIPNLARTLLGELAAREQVLAPQLAVGGRELEEIPQRALEEARLRRDMEMGAALYTSVQQRYDEARLAEASSVADVRILDAAVAPQERMKDMASRLLVLGFAVGLGLGLAGAVVADRIDPRMRYPTQVTRQMGLPILGVLPHVSDRGAAPGDEDVTQVLESMRSIRLNLTHAYGAPGPIIVTITSPGVGDGKSLVSANLALAYAEAGYRTLLIDGDARRGALHRALRVSRKPGLTDTLAGRVSIEEVTQKTTWSSLEFIGAGSRFRDSPELLASAAMVELVARVRSRYQVIIVDSPPLGSGVDPYTLGTVTGGVLLVLRSGTTNLEFAQSKLGALEYLPIRLLGAIVNDVRPGGGYRYYSYLSGYSTADEGTAIVKHRIRGMI